MKKKTLYLIARICKNIHVGKWSFVLTSLLTLVGFILIGRVYPETHLLPFALSGLIFLGICLVSCIIATILCLAINFFGNWIERQIE